MPPLLILWPLLLSCAPDPVERCLRYPDGDGDGLGDAALPVALCDPTPGYVNTPGDCDDNAPSLTVIAAWADEDGDGFADEATKDDACAPSLVAAWDRLRRRA